MYSPHAIRTVLHSIELCPYHIHVVAVSVVGNGVTLVLMLGKIPSSRKIHATKHSEYLRVQANHRAAIHRAIGQRKLCVSRLIFVNFKVFVVVVAADSLQVGGNG